MEYDRGDRERRHDGPYPEWPCGQPGAEIRFTDPEKPGSSTPVTRGRIALEIEAAEIYFRNVEIRELE